MFCTVLRWARLGCIIMHYGSHKTKDSMQEEVKESQSKQNMKKLGNRRHICWAGLGYIIMLVCQTPWITQINVTTGSQQEDAGVQRKPKQKREIAQERACRDTHVLLPSFQNMVPNMRAMPMVKEKRVAL